MGRYGHSESLDSMEELDFELATFNEDAGFESELSLEASEIEAEEDGYTQVAVGSGINSLTHSAREIAAAILAARNH